MAPATFSGFFDLPGELRDQILTYLLVKPEGIHIDTCSNLLHETTPEPRFKSPALSSVDSDDDEWNSEGPGPGSLSGEEGKLGWPLNYFLVSQTFHREASAVFFGDNEFYLYATKTPRGTQRRRPKNKNRHDSGGHEHEFRHLESLRRLRRVVLYAQRLGGLLEGLFIPMLRGMTLSGGLKHLDVRVCPSVQGARGAAGLWGSSPGRGLLGLLRDPDLEVARLRICLGILLPGKGSGEGREEVASWCPSREGPGGRLVTLADREGRVWCDLDVGELARRYGGEEVGIFKVGEERSLLRWAAG
ncbi:hypothetical protein VMCG_03472 [Cytospora schulzeri]|uniref:F-box domain-containing protein n=1 Tax=Cytospora schulzeri TaxID=448051 RepID=A0A423WW59_9PEZI|nr:hypothetical protein VMCG_03472 [Valsa malicola]